MDVVARIKIAAEHTVEVLTDQLLDHFTSTRMMVLVIANAGSGDAPDVAISAIFSPSCFICLDGWTSADLRFECIELGLHLLLEPVEHLNDLSTADLHPMQCQQVGLELSNGQTHHCTQGGDQAGKSHSNTSLAHHLIMQIHRRFMPFLTPCTPALVDTMFRHLDWRGRGDIDDLSSSSQTDASQTQMTLWAVHNPLLHDLGWRGA